METVLKEAAALRKRQAASLKTSGATLDYVMQQMNEARTAVRAGNADAVSILAANLERKDPLNKIKEEHKLLHASVAKLGKAIDKAAPEVTERPCIPTEPNERLLVGPICDHLWRTGRADIATALHKASPCDISCIPTAKLQFLSNMLASFREGDLEPCLEWASANCEQLTALQSPLEFRLYELRMLQLLQQRGAAVAIDFARTYLFKFADTRLPDISKLMTACLYHDRLTESPYAALVSPARSHAVAKLICQAACQLMGLAPVSPLETAYMVGQYAMPALVKMSKLPMAKSDTFLPVEIELQPQHTYHSVFACPVTRSQCLDDNPPMLLRCGHVICKESLQRLAHLHSRFKCPTCPVIQSSEDAQQISFT